jgi:hypothetical protein
MTEGWTPGPPLPAAVSEPQDHYCFNRADSYGRQWTPGPLRNPKTDSGPQDHCYPPLQLPCDRADTVLLANVDKQLQKEAAPLTATAAGTLNNSQSNKGT